ncbi:MAG: GspE/PulE family protein [Patescibacteria group bacterium]|nr:GspE/PulE family protein [Patescibacteria group bacterium]
MNKQEELLNLLIKNKLISSKQLAEVKETADFIKKSVEDVLLEKNIIDIEKLTRIKADIYKLPYQNLLNKKIKDRAIYTISIEAAENYKIICFERGEKRIKVGLVNPDDFKATEAINFLAKEENLQVEYYLISILSFNGAFKLYKTLTKEVSTVLETKAKAEAEEIIKLKKIKNVEFEEVIKSAPITKIVSVIIRHAVDGRASDIHIEPLQKESRVRYRIDGVLHTSLVIPKNAHSAIVARIKVLANLKLDETRIPQDGRIRLTVNKKEIDFRISIIPLMGEEKVVMRILDTTKGAPDLEELGFVGRGLTIIKKGIAATSGMLLVTGPTGSGKSTTLFSVLNKVNKEGINISTLEDPVEYFVKGVNQSQVRPEIGYTFAAGLRSFLRQDPDVIMVGEIRDNETAELAIHASLTGHLVLSTLHTNDAIGAIPRLLDMKVEPFLLSSTLNTVVAQRLVRKICSHCQIECKLSTDIITNIKKEISKIPSDLINEIIPDFNIDKLIFYKGKGCSRCGNSGYSGRVAIAEVLDINDKIKEIIMDDNKNLSMDDIINSQKFITLKQDGIIKMLQGFTTFEEILRVAQN